MASIGLEPTTYGLEDRCSIQLSYEAIIGASGGSRTHTSIRITDFKSVASTVPPHSLYYCIKAQVVNCVNTLNVFFEIIFWPAREDSNFRPSVPQTDALSN